MVDMSERVEYHRRITKEWKQKHPEETKEQKKRWREKHKNDIKETNKKYRQDLRNKCLIHYGGNPPKCSCCGETIIGFLTIDHLYGGGNNHRKQLFGTKQGGWMFYLWLVKNNFPEGFQVLCYNCNCGKAHNNGICPHKLPP
jgi:hypothetical protein